MCVCICSGLFYQGYECSKCQKRLHRECIRKIPLCFQRSNSHWKSIFNFIPLAFCFSASLGRIRSFDRGSIELPRAFSNASSVNNHSTCIIENEHCLEMNLLDRAYALYDYDGTVNNGNSRSQSARFGERHIRVNEGDELEVVEDDDEHMWKVIDNDHC